MEPRPRFRRLLLLLAVLIVPAAAVVALGVRTVSQERKLAAQRAVDERARTARGISSAFVAYMEGLRIRAGAIVDSDALFETRDYGDPAIVLVTVAEGGELRLPWEGPSAKARTQRFSDVLDDDRTLRAGERREAEGNLARAIALYSSVVENPSDTVQEAYARLLLARALRAAGRSEEARLHDRFVLSLGPDISDEHGIPLALYAAERLAGEVPSAELRNALEGIATWPLWLCPEALYLLSSVASGLAGGGDTRDAWASAVAREASQRAAVTRLVGNLADGFPMIDAALLLENRSPEEPAWWMLDSPAWLISESTDSLRSEPFVLVTDADSVLQSLEGDAALTGVRNVRLADSSDGEAYPVGPLFPNLRLSFDLLEDPAAASGWSRQTTFLGSVLVLVLALSALGAYLLLRDVRREVRVAALRSGFVSSVSHELRTPLAAIRMLADIMREKPRTEDDPEGEYLDSIAGESERLSRLLDNVLDFSKIERGEKRYQRTACSLGEVVTKAAHTMRYILEKEDFRLRLEVDDGLPPASADADAIEQAILNLVTNAVKYSGEARTIDLRLRRRDGFAVIEVRDQGIGIAGDERERIFEQFFRGGAPENDSIPGTGLGLTVVRHIVDAHGGFITLESEPGKGSTFRLHLPLEEEGRDDTT